MTNKTPLQELIEWMSDSIEEYDPVYVIGLEAARHKARTFLEKEKNIIVDAYDYGKDDGTFPVGRKAKSGTEYFNQTFKP